MKKIIVLLILVIALATAGCAEQANASDDESSTDVQQVQVVSPVTINDDRELYWQWHKETHDILESKIGEDVKLYAYSIQYKGELLEVTDFYAVIDDDISGEIYVDIGSLNAIAGQTVNIYN